MLIKSTVFFRIDLPFGGHHICPIHGVPCKFGQDIFNIKDVVLIFQKGPFFLMSQGSLYPKIRFLGQKVCPVGCLRTDTHTDRVTPVGTLSGFQDFFLKPIIKDRPNKKWHYYLIQNGKRAVFSVQVYKYVRLCLTSLADPPPSPPSLSHIL